MCRHAIVRCLLATLILLVGLASTATAQSSRSPAPLVSPVQPERPAALVPLYVTFAGLQALDVHSTWMALGAGAKESNPIVRGTLGNPAGMVAMKSATAVGVMLLTEKLWRHHRTAAVVSMIALNSAYAVIAARNYRLAK
jgi:hypothetical protein